MKKTNYNDVRLGLMITTLAMVIVATVMICMEYLPWTAYILVLAIDGLAWYIIELCQAIEKLIIQFKLKPKTRKTP